MALNHDWREFLGLLESFGVEFLVVGAWARAFHGEPRMTGDIDFWVRRSQENAGRAVFDPSGVGRSPDCQPRVFAAGSRGSPDARPGANFVGPLRGR